MNIPQITRSVRPVTSEIIVIHIGFIKYNTFRKKYNTVIGICRFSTFRNRIIRLDFAIADIRNGNRIANLYFIASCKICRYIAAHRTLDTAIPKAPFIQNACLAEILDRVRRSKSCNGDIVFCQSLVLCCLQLSRKCCRVIADDQVDVRMIRKNSIANRDCLLCILIAVVVVRSNILPVRVCLLDILLACQEF